jgi:hypothetical protein
MFLARRWVPMKQFSRREQAPNHLKILTFMLSAVVLLFSTSGLADAQDTECDMYANAGYVPPTGVSPDGSFDKPYQTLEAMTTGLTAGQTGCIREGTPIGDYRNDSDKITYIKNSGTADAPITIQSYPGERATVLGEIKVNPGKNFIVVKNLISDGTGGNKVFDAKKNYYIYDPNFLWFGDDGRIENVEMTNRDPGPVPATTGRDTEWASGGCILVGTGSSADPQYIADRLTFVNNRVHSCGSPGNPAAPNNSRPPDQHGFYAAWMKDSVIRDNLFYDEGEVGIKLRGDSDRNVVRNNVLDGAWGNIFSNGYVNSQGTKLSPDGNTVSNNIISRARAWNFYQTIENGATPSGNLFQDNCVNGTRSDAYFNPPSNFQTNTTGWTQSGTVLTNPDSPGYTDPDEGDFRLKQGSACAGKGPSYLQPPVVLASSVASTDHDAWLSSAPSTSYPVPATSLARNASTTALTVERTFYSGKYYVRGAELRFDTSDIPASAGIEGATLTLYPTGVSTANSRSLAVEWFKDWTGTSRDWTVTASASAGSVPLAAIAPDQPVSIPLQSAPANVNRDGYTDFRLHVDGGQPSGLNKVVLAGYGSTVGQPARLEVSYRPR